MNDKTKYDFIDEARVIASRCWCSKETKNIEMDVDLAESFASQLALWMQTAAQNQRNTDYYRGLLVECGESIGDRAFSCEDGSISEDVLCAKIPDIIATDYANGE